MTRLLKSEGALETGWQITRGSHVFMAGTRKAEAMEILREVIAEYFDR